MIHRLAILERLKEGRTITPKEAMEEFGCMRLGARIWDLRHEGYDIRKRMIAVPTRNGIAHVAEYHLEGNDETV